MSEDYAGKRLYRCRNPKCTENPAGTPGYEFWAAPGEKGLVSCPKCNIASTDPRLGRLITPLQIVHYEPPSEVDGIGAGHLACKRGETPLKGSVRSGEPSVVNCPYCKSTDAWKANATAATLSAEFDVPVTIDAAKEAYKLASKG